MRYNPFHSNLKEFRDAKDDVMVKDILLAEISDAVVHRKHDVIDKLNRSGLYVDSSTSVKDLSDIVTKNLDNKKFLKGLSSIIALKTPSDFEHFSSVNGNKVTEKDYVSDIYFAVDGNVKADDKDSLSEKTMKLLESIGIKTAKAGSGSGRMAFGIFAASALGIYFIAIRPLSKTK